MKFQITFKAKKAIELLTKLNKNDFFGLLNKDDLYYINTIVATRAIEMLNYKFTNEECDLLPDIYSYEEIFDADQATRDFWCLFSNYDFYANSYCCCTYSVARALWQSAGGNNFEFENHVIRGICLFFSEKIEYKRACNEDDYDKQEELDETARDRYTESIALVGEAFYSILTALELLTIKEIAD